MRPKRVLVVDDQPNWQQVISSLLADSGYCVDTANSGSAAWTLLKSNTYDAMIVDVRLVDANPYDIQGVELVERIHSELQEPLPVVVMTGYSFEGLKEIMESRYGVKLFIRKGTPALQSVQSFRTLISSVLG